MQFLVDTLSFRSTLSVKNLFSLFGLKMDEIDFVEGTPFNGYPHCIFYQGIKIGFGGYRGFETYVHMSGKGCRTLEDLIPGLCWEKLITDLRSMPDDIHIARIDIACDDFSDTLKLERLEKYYFAGKYASRCKHITFIKGAEEICYIGSPQSDCRIRIYNKKLERGYTEPEDLDGKPWYRCEFQFRDNVATAFCDEWLKRGELGITFLVSSANKFAS